MQQLFTMMLCKSQIVLCIWLWQSWIHLIALKALRDPNCWVLERTVKDCDIPEELMVRECGHAIGVVGDSGHAAEDKQRLGTCYMRLLEITAINLLQRVIQQIVKHYLYTVQISQGVWFNRHCIKQGHIIHRTFHRDFVLLLIIFLLVVQESPFQKRNTWVWGCYNCQQGRHCTHFQC